MPHLESKTKLIITASVNKYIKPIKIIKNQGIYFGWVEGATCR